MQFMRFLVAYLLSFVASSFAFPKVNLRLGIIQNKQSTCKKVQLLGGSISLPFCFRGTTRIRTAINMEQQSAGGLETDSLDTLNGLFGNVTEHISPSNLNDAISAFRHMLSFCASPPPTPPSFDVNTPRIGIEQEFARCCIQAANYMCQAEPALSKKKAWTNLQEKAQSLQQDPHNFQASALAVSFLFGALALMGGDASKAAASAISSTVSRNKPLRHNGQPIAHQIIKSFLIHACYSDALNFTILTHFAKAFKLTDEVEPGTLTQLSANALQFGLGLPQEEEKNGGGSAVPSSPSSLVADDDAASLSDEEYKLRKQKLSGALAFACQIRPWPIISPTTLIEVSISYRYWHILEQICLSAYEKAATTAAQTSSTENFDPINDGSSTMNNDLADAIIATETLINAVMEDRLYRLADNIATKLYNEGGKSRYVEARYYHAQDTINKVIRKRQIPIIERQVDRVDKAVAKVQGDTKGDNQRMVQVEGSGGGGGDGEITTEQPASAWSGSEIRRFALQRLQEEGEIEAVHRLSEMWGVDYVYDDEAMLKAEAARRKKYIQFDEVMSGEVPELIATPNELRRAFDSLRRAPYQKGPIGFDAEWDEDTNGASILQLANPKGAILLDIPLLSSTADGCSALDETVGALFDSEEFAVVGFCPRQDLSRMRGSAHQSKHHWLRSTHAVVDAQKLAAQNDPRLAKIGLSRLCHHYFGKPLDKSEQCSYWSSRPLSVKQRTYAALDAWVCAAVYEKLRPERITPV